MEAGKNTVSTARIAPITLFSVLFAFSCVCSNPWATAGTVKRQLLSHTFLLIELKRQPAGMMLTWNLLYWGMAESFPIRTRASKLAAIMSPNTSVHSADKRMLSFSR